MIKKITISIVLAVLCLNFSSKGQEARALTPLHVGDKLPDGFWTENRQVFQNGTVSTQNLLQYKSKLLILDFWATWCGSCLVKFPLLTTLEDKFSPSVKVMAVNSIGTKDDLDRISTKLLGKIIPYKKYTLPSIFGDSTILAHFPHRTIPHYVWIIDGVVSAITSSEFINEENINALLETSKKTHQMNEMIKKYKKIK